MKLPRVVVADDHSVVLAGIRTLLEKHCHVIEQARDGLALVEAALRLRPDLIILDVSMPLLNGIDAARQIKRAWPEARLLFLSMHASAVYLREALDAGGCGFLLKSSATEELQPAIARVLKKQVYVDPAFGPEVLEKMRTPSGRQSRSSAKLTDRQRQVLQLVAEGKSNKEVAQTLHLSIKTAEFHRARIMSKLGIHSTAELATFAVRSGLVGE